MPAVKTKVKEPSVAEFLDKVSDEGLRKDSRVLLELFQKATKTEPKLWSGNIIGFGTYHYVNKSGRQGDWCLAGFSPRSQTLTLFVLGGWDEEAELLAKLGKHSLRQEVLTIKRLDDVNGPALKRLIGAGLKRAKRIAQDEAKKQA